MSNTLKGLHILLGVTGGIAAYKSAELCRLFVKSGATVQVVMTEAACEFITPLTMETLSGRPVPVHMFHRTQGPLEHIDLPTEADIMVVAPATADYLARCASGRACDLMSSITLAFTGPVIAAVAMNTNMYNNPATQRNLATLREDHGWHLIEPESGELACKTIGKGRMAEPQQILQEVRRLQKRDLAGKTILITAGPTVEDIDPVRYISNRSSGKTGYALASHAISRGADVILVSGPVALTPPARCTTIQVRSALEMETAVLSQCDRADAIVMCAAVADFRPARISHEKMKKRDFTHIELSPNPDILAGLGARFAGSPKPMLIGFALETENLQTNAADKLRKKGVHAIISNLAQDALEGDRTRVTVIRADKEPLQTDFISKSELADIILNLICQ